VIQNDIAIDLPRERDQLLTRSDARFGELRAEVYERVQFAKTNVTGQSEPARLVEAGA